MSAANDAEFAKVARAKAVTHAAEQSGFGKVMSRIFSKRALAEGLRGTPQTVAVGLALEAAMSYSAMIKPVHRMCLRYHFRRTRYGHINSSRWG